MRSSETFRGVIRPRTQRLGIIGRVAADTQCGQYSRLMSLRPVPCFFAILLAIAGIEMRGPVES